MQAEYKKLFRRREIMKINMFNIISTPRILAVVAAMSFPRN